MVCCHHVLAKLILPAQTTHNSVGAGAHDACWQMVTMGHQPAMMQLHA
jgi:hypothetical protein